MAEKTYLRDVLLQKKPFDYKNENGEIVKLYECYSMTESEFDENGYFIKHFYTTQDKIANIKIGDFVKVRFSKTYSKFYLGD